ncbi:MAG: aspartate 1-decarboxylase [Halanaerobiales bacterium]|nr:aspartate 1-decarboxylase [Halanaerobiales bacterium]
MYRTMLKAKLHRVRVTEANLEYRGSITIDQDIMDKADILPHEKVQVVNINNGARFETYVLPGERGSKTICLNGAAARLAQVGDRVIIMSYALLNEKEITDWEPKVILFDEENNIIS